jgi:hypothetical protein
MDEFSDRIMNGDIREVLLDGAADGLGRLHYCDKAALV